MLSTAAVLPAAPPAARACSPKAHEAMKAGRKVWLSLRLVGYQPGLGTDLYEMRNCRACGSTLMRPVEVVKVRFVRDPQPAQPRARRASAAAGVMQ